MSRQSVLKVLVWSQAQCNSWQADPSTVTYKAVNLVTLRPCPSVQSLTSRALGSDLHPAAKFGKGVYIAHPLGAARRPLPSFMFYSLLRLCGPCLQLACRSVQPLQHLKCGFRLGGQAFCDTLCRMCCWSCVQCFISCLMGRRSRV